MAKGKKSSFRGKVASDSKRQQSQGSSYGHLMLPKGVSVFSPKPGSKVKLDFMPYEVTDEKHPDKNADLDIAVVGTLWYKRPYKVHKKIGSDEDTVVCLASIGKKCPICEYRAKRQAAGADKEELAALKQSLRVLYAVIPLDSKEHEVKPYLMDISQYLFQNLLNDELEEDEDYQVFPDLEEGLSLKIRFDSSTIGSSKPFAEASRIDFEKRKKPYSEDILKDVPNLDKVLKILTYAELDAKFLEMDPEDIGKDDNDDAPKKDKKKDKKDSKPEKEEKSDRKKKKVEEEPEEEPEKEAAEDMSLEDAIGEAEDVEMLLEIAKSDDVFKKHMKTLKTITKKKLLKTEMLAILESAKPVETEDDDDDDDDDDAPELSWEMLEEMSYNDMKTLCKEGKLTTKAKDYDDDLLSLRKAIAKELNIEVPKAKKVAEEKGGKKKVKEEKEEKKKTSPSKEKCPNKHQFGVDTDKFKDCNDCPLWDDCLDAKESKKK